MMNMVCEKYPNIPWLYNSKGELKKENYDSCDALICALAYSNGKRYGEPKPKIVSHEITEEKIIYPETNEQTDIKYTIRYKVKIWDKIFDKKLII